MSITIYYRGNIDNVYGLIDVVIRLSNEFEWTLTNTCENVCVNIPNCEELVLSKNDNISGFIKYSGENQETLYHIFEFFRKIEPYFEKFQINDDFGLWDNYISQFSKHKLPYFRELKENEKAELNRGFDLPKGSNSIFGMGQAQAVLMFIISKDMNDGLTIPFTLDSLMELVDERCKQMLILDLNDCCFQLMGIAETWFLTKLYDNCGNAIKMKKGKMSECTLFGWFMAEIIFGFNGGYLGGKHQKLRCFLDELNKQNIDFNNTENFLRLIYSVIEYLGGFRPDRSINRKPIQIN